MPSSEANDFLLQQYLRALAEASRARDTERALAIGDEASRRGIEHPNLLGLAAQKHMRAGDAEAAVPATRSWNNWFLLQYRSGRTCFND